MKKQLSHVIADAFNLVYPGEEISMDWFEAICETKEQAKKMYFQVNAKLQTQRAINER